MAIVIYLFGTGDGEGPNGALTKEQGDANFSNLKAAIEELGEYTGNNQVLFKNNGGSVVTAVIEENRLFGRTAGQQISSLTAAQAKAILSIEIGDVTGLSSSLTGKASAVHGHIIDDVTGLQDALDDKADTSALDDKADLTELTTVTGYFGGLKTVFSGQVVLVAGTGSVSFAGVTDTDLIALTAQSGGVNSGALYIDNIEGGAGFTIKSTNAADVANVFYEVKRAI